LTPEEKSDDSIVAMKPVKAGGAKGVMEWKSMESQQLTFAFADSPSGGGRPTRADALARASQLLRTTRAKLLKDSGVDVTDVSRLLEQVAHRHNLLAALDRVVQNKGAPGTDRQSVEEVLLHKDGLLPKLQAELLSGNYQPGDVRRVWIPKPGGGQRGLGIPNVVDRWVQQAVLQVLEPIFEPTFHDSSHGFRRSKSAHTAIAEAQSYVADGRTTVVDIDLAKFFDRVNHQRLLSRMGQRITDPRVLKLVERMLKAKVVLPDGTRVSSEEGTPQGGPLSPLLSNIVLDELDRELDRRGHRFVRYADDCNIYVRSVRAGQRVMDSIRRFLEQRLRLQINEEKSQVAAPDEIHFLGFRLQRGTDGVTRVDLSKRSQQRIADRIVELTPRNWGGALEDCMGRTNSYLRGWIGFFRICTKQVTSRLHAYDAHIRRRLRAIIVKQRKRALYLYRHLCHRKVREQTAAKAAFCQRGPWYISATGGMHSGYRNAWFAERLVSLEELWKALNPTPRPTQTQKSLFGDAE
jgi:group II intron reverse transcriptase/maturase